MVIAFLLATTIILILLGSHLAAKYHKYEVTPQAAAQTEARIAHDGAARTGVG